MSIDLHPAGARFVTAVSWVTSRHSFSYGPHYDPANTRFGRLIAHNDDVLAPGGRFDLHPHRGIDIVTWVLDGELTHSDDTGGSGVVRPGLAQLLNAGSGVCHVEANVTDQPVRYAQMWIMSDDDQPPSYATADVSAALAEGEFVLVASDGDVPAPLSLRAPGAAFLVARLPAGATATLPANPLAHLYVAKGEARIGGSDADVPLGVGDALRARAAGELAVTALADAELLAWVFSGLSPAPTPAPTPAPAPAPAPAPTRGRT